MSRTFAALLIRTTTEKSQLENKQNITEEASKINKKGSKLIDYPSEAAHKTHVSA